MSSARRIMWTAFCWRKLSVLAAALAALLLLTDAQQVAASHSGSTRVHYEWTFDTDLDGWTDISGGTNFIQQTAGELELVDVVGASNDSGRAMAEVLFAPIEASYFAYDYRSTDASRALFVWWYFTDGTRTNALHNHGNLFDEYPDCRTAIQSDVTYRLEHYFNPGTGTQRVYVDGAYVCDYRPNGQAFPYKPIDSIKLMTDNTQTNFSVFVDNILLDTESLGWRPARPLPTTLFGSRAAVTDDFLYLIGGSNLAECSPRCQHVWRSPLTGIEPGAASDWMQQPDVIPVTGGEHLVAIVGDWLFVLVHESTAGDVVMFRSAINQSDGTVSAAVPVALPGSNANSPRLAAAGGRLYLVDRPSNTGESPLPTSYGSVDAVTGAVTWTATAAPNGSRASFEVVSDGQHVYLIGGNTGGTGAAAQTDVQFATIDPATGALSSWQHTAALNRGRSQQLVAAVVGETIFVVAGADETIGIESSRTRRVETAEIQPDGTLSAWVDVEPYPFGTSTPAIAAIDGLLWVGGGGWIDPNPGGTGQPPRAEGYVFGEASQPPDTTPPEIIPVIDGQLGLNGWYVSDVTLEWLITDPESPIDSTVGCGDQLIDLDTAGTPFTCTATSAGGSDSETVEIKRDATAPVVEAPEDLVVPTDGGPVDASDPRIVAFLTAAAATDVTSGVISEDHDAPASFPFGPTVVTFSAADEAGNTDSDQATVTVVLGCDGIPATIVGTDWPETIHGTNGPDVIVALGGDDRVFGHGGNDTICGGAGQDTLVGGAGDDTLLGDSGWDRLDGGDGHDTLDGGAGLDRIYGRDGNDAITGGNGRDRIFGGRGNDTIDAGAGHDVIRGDDGDDALQGGPGNDRIDGGAGNDTIHAGPGNDVVWGRDGDDVIEGGLDDNWLYAGFGNDTITGGPTTDVIFGGAGDDAMNGGDGRDYCNGEVGADTAVACEVVISASSP